MPRRMSVALTLDAVRTRTKTVTRRRADTWEHLRPGDRLTLVEKGMGLPKGARQVIVAEVEVVDVRIEPLGLVGLHELDREGFPDAEPDAWQAWWASSHGYAFADLDAIAEIPVRRIEWRYLDEEARP